MTTCLFDIDGTLITTGGSGGRAMFAAVTQEFDVPHPEQQIPFAGRSDRAIVPDIFRAAGVPLTDETWNRFTERYLSNLARELVASDGRVLHGVEGVLARLSAAAGIDLGLLTGNLEAGARVKLKHFQINDYFSFGGFGDEHPHRDDIARHAAEVVRERFDDARDIVVIGDTPADIQCGRAINATTVAVATGSFSCDELAAKEPDHVFETLADATPFFEELVESAPR